MRQQRSLGQWSPAKLRAEAPDRVLEVQSQGRGRRRKKDKGPKPKIGLARAHTDKGRKEENQSSQDRKGLSASSSATKPVQRASRNPDDGEDDERNCRVKGGELPWIGIP